MTNLRGYKKRLSILLCIMLVMGTLTGFTYQDGFGNVYFESNKEIFNGVTYGEIQGSNNANGIEHAYVVHADNQENGLKPMVFNGEVTATYTVADMIKYTEAQGYKVLAAINGDIFDTSTGVPKGLTISRGNIVTSGYAPEMSLTFDGEGRASMKKTYVSYTLKGIMSYTEAVPGEPASPAQPETESPPPEPTAAETTRTVDKEFTSNIGFFNVPQGQAKGLHLYNRHYAKSTKTKSRCVEVVIDTGSSDNIQLKIDGAIKGTVKSIHKDTTNTPIGETEVVLSAVMDSAFVNVLSSLKVGSEVEITAKDNYSEGLIEAVEAVGIYYSIVKDGKVDTTGTNPNPRTVVGIKEDGSLIFYVLDGRQPSISNGLGLFNTAKHMIALGCVSAFNMDGGGSSVLYARLPGLESSAMIKNSPAQLSQRRVTNGILLAYKDKAPGTSEQLNIYPALTLVMPGAEARLSTYASNSLFEKAGLPGTVSYTVSSNGGTISSDGVFTAGQEAGKVQIQAESGNLKGFTEVEIIHPSNLNYSASVTSLNLDTAQTADVDMVVRTGVAKVNSKDSLFQWSCDPEIGAIDENGLFKATSLNGKKGNIYIGYNGSKITIPVTVGKEILDFYDTKTHWAREYIGKMASRGLVAGVGDNMFMPDANITRAQFLAMLAKTIPDLDLGSYPVTEFKDVPSNEWYVQYVNWGYANSIVNGIDEVTFAPNDNITREQMTIMLCNFSRAIGFAIPQVKTAITFPDSGSISPWAADYVATVVGGGIMNGDSTGYFYPQGLATRAQAVKVVYVFTNVKDGIE